MTYKNQLLLITLIGVSILSWIVIHKKNGDSSKIFNATLVVGTNAEYPPFSFIENNTIVGFDIDVIKEVAHRLGKQILFKDMRFEALIPQVQLGSIQVIAAGMSPSPERTKQVFFTPAYLTNDPLIILTLRNTIINTTDDLQNKQVVVNEGFTADYFISNLKIPQITRLASVDEALLALQTRRVDAFVTAQSAVQSFLALHGDNNFNKTIIPNTEEQYTFIVSKKYPTLYAEITKIIDDMKEDGTLDQIKKQWHL